MKILKWIWVDNYDYDPNTVTMLEDVLFSIKMFIKMILILVVAGVGMYFSFKYFSPEHIEINTEKFLP